MASKFLTLLKENRKELLSELKKVDRHIAIESGRKKRKKWTKKGKVSKPKPVET